MAVHECPLTTDGVASFRGCTVKPGAPTACRCTCVRNVRATSSRYGRALRGCVSQCTVLTGWQFSFARAESCPFLSLSVRVGPRKISRGLYHRLYHFLHDVPYVRRSRNGCHVLSFELSLQSSLWWFLRNCFRIFIPNDDICWDTNVCSGDNLSTRRRHPGTYYRRRRNVSSVSRDQRRGPSRSPVARCFPLRSRLSNVSGPALAACQQVPVGSGFEDSGGRGQERHRATTIPLGWFYPFGTRHQSTASCTTNGWSCLYPSRRPFQIPRIVAPLRQRHETVTLVRAALPSRSILWRSVPWKNLGVISFKLLKNIEKLHFLLLK